MSDMTLILSRKEIEKLLDMRQALRIVEEAFREQARLRIRMPAKIYVNLPKYNGDFRAMPAYLEGLAACGIKWVNVHPDNKRKGLPSVMAVIVLSDPATGFPLAVMDGTHITNLRTGAAGGVAAKYLANKGSSRVSIVGCGKQAETQLIALNEVFRLKSVFVYDRNPLKAGAFLKKMGYLGLDMEYRAVLKDCVTGRDIVVTVTPARKPIIRSGWISGATHINAIGADAKGKEELDPAILKKAKVVVDEKAQAIHSGEINVPISKDIMKESDIAASLGEVIIGARRGRTRKDEITIFDSTGLAIHDIAVAKHVYDKARREGLGRGVRLV
jgi:alanine dehydrogenase